MHLKIKSQEHIVWSGAIWEQIPVHLRDGGFEQIPRIPASRLNDSRRVQLGLFSLFCLKPEAGPGMQWKHTSNGWKQAMDSVFFKAHGHGKSTSNLYDKKVVSRTPWNSWTGGPAKGDDAWSFSPMQCSSWSWHALGFRGETRRSSLAFDLEGTTDLSLVQKGSGKGFIIVCPLNSDHSESYVFWKGSILFSCFVCLGAKDVCRLHVIPERCFRSLDVSTHAALRHGAHTPDQVMSCGVYQNHLFYSIVAPHLLYSIYMYLPHACWCKMYCKKWAQHRYSHVFLALL